MQFYDHWKRPPKHPEEMFPDTLTESKGYIPAHKQVENLINAGKRLMAWRREQYDFPDGTDVDESFEDPTRRSGYDLVDASRDLQDVELRLRAQADAALDRKKKTRGSNDTADPSKIDPEQSSEVSTKVDEKEKASKSR